VVRRFLVLLCIALPIVLVGYPVFTSVQVWATSHQDQMHPADAIVVLGAAQYDGRPSPVLQARLDHALYLYRQQMAPVVITTGGKLPGDTFTEGDTGIMYLRTQGVPAGDTLAETSGTSTYESLRNVAGIALPRGIRSVLIVTDPLHSARAQRMALDLGFQAAYTSPDNYVELNRSTRTKLDEFVKETAALMLYRVGLDRA
jgi:uncharacterized SAM-binding protein YcdF (DUF218 family)